MTKKEVKYLILNSYQDYRKFYNSKKEMEKDFFAVKGKQKNPVSIPKMSMNKLAEILYNGSKKKPMFVYKKRK